MFIKNKNRYSPIQKYKIGQWVYIYHDNILQRALIVGIIFDYNCDPREKALTKPEYIVEVGIDRGAHYSAGKNENELFKTKQDCITYVLEHGLIEQEE